jgi:nitroreductase
MEIQIDSWFNAISERHSRRAYTGKSLSDANLNHLEKVCSEFRPFRGARSTIVRNPPDNVFRGAIGSYGKIRNAPHFIAFIGDTAIPEVQEAVGYLGEGIILEATSMNIQTCWVGGFFRQEVVEDIVELRNSERVLAITPIGQGLDSKSRTERTFSRLLRAHRRKPLENLIVEASDSYPEWMNSALEAARLAPSAANRQPWRFLIENYSITVRTDDLRDGRWVSKRFDCGIAMLHLELGAKVKGVEGYWEFLSTPEVARYIVS